MRSAIMLWLLLGVPGAVWAQAGSQPVSAQQAALAWLDAVKAGDLKTADAGCVGFAAWKALSKRALAEETNCHLIGTAHFSRHRRAGRYTGTTADNGVGPQVTRLLVRDVH